jgi:hypothetical protein
MLTEGAIMVKTLIARKDDKVIAIELFLKIYH